MLKSFIASAFLLIACGSSINENKTESLISEINNTNSISVSIDSSFPPEDIIQIREAMAEWNYAIDNTIFVESNTGVMIWNVPTHPFGDKSVLGWSDEESNIELFMDRIDNKNITTKSIVLHELGHHLFIGFDSTHHLDHGLMSLTSDGIYTWDCIDQYTVDVICETTDLCGDNAAGTC